MSSISNALGDKTNDTVGNQTLLNKTTTLASHSIEYAKGLTGMGKTSTTSDVKDAATDSQGGQTLGGLINESRDLAADVLGVASDIIKSKTDEAKQAVDDKPEAKSYLDSARDTAASLISTAEGYVKSGADKAQEVAATKSTNDIKSDVNAKASEVVNDAAEAGKELKSTAAAYATEGLDKSKGTAEELQERANNF